MSTRYDLCVVYDDDADEWSRYIVHHLGREHFRYRLLPVTDRLLLDWLMTLRNCGVTVPSLREASEARSFIVVVSPGLVALMVEQPQLDFLQLVEHPRTAQVSSANRLDGIVSIKESTINCERHDQNQRLIASSTLYRRYFLV